MQSPIYTNNYRRNLELFWRRYYTNWSIPSGYHVHHIKPKCTFEDKTDPRIHHPKNLIALHPDDHVSIHKCRGDAIVEKFIFVGGHKHTQETKDKISIAGTGKKRTSAARQRISNAKIGNKNPMFGQTPSDETIQKRKNSRKGYQHSQKTKDKIGAKTKGRTHSEETKAKIRAARAKQVMSHRSDKTKKKMSESAKLRELKKKQDRIDLCRD